MGNYKSTLSGNVKEKIARNKMINEISDGDANARYVCNKLMSLYECWDPKKSIEGKNFFEKLDPHANQEELYKENNPLLLLKANGIKGAMLWGLFNSYNKKEEALYYGLAYGYSMEFLNPKVVRE